MNHKLTRRRFVQVAAAGAAAIASVPLARTILAQQPPTLILGVRPGPIPGPNNVAPEVNTTEGSGTAAASTTTAGLAVPLLVQSLDLATGHVQTLQTLRFLQDGSTPVLRSNEALTGFSVLANGTRVVAITPINTSNSTRLTLLVGTSANALTVSGLMANERLESVLGTADGRLLGLVGHKNGTPPVRLASIDPLTGTISFTGLVVLPGNQRFSTLAQSPDGKLYTTAVGRKGETSLLHLDLAQHRLVTVASLHVNTTPWNNGLESLVYSPGGQLLAFGAPRYKTPNAVYAVDVSSGAMTFLKDFDVARITISRT